MSCWARAVLVPMALAVLLTFVLTPPVGWLERWMGHHDRSLRRQKTSRLPDERSRAMLWKPEEQPR